MGKIVKNIEELVGHTPLFEFVKYEEKHSLQAHLLGKLKYFNPSGSIKDRAALNMIRAAERDGILKPGDTIVENTSGNTGIGLAAFAASRGYKLTVFLEPGQSEERQKMLKAYGTDLRSMFDVPGVAEAMANLQRSFIRMPFRHIAMHSLRIIILSISWRIRRIRVCIMRQPDRRSGRIQKGK